MWDLRGRETPQKTESAPPNSALLPLELSSILPVCALQDRKPETVVLAKQGHGSAAVSVGCRLLVCLKKGQDRIRTCFLCMLHGTALYCDIPHHSYHTEIKEGPPWGAPGVLGVPMTPTSFVLCALPPPARRQDRLLGFRAHRSDPAVSSRPQHSLDICLHWHRGCSSSKLLAEACSRAARRCVFTLQS